MTSGLSGFQVAPTESSQAVSPYPGVEDNLPWVFALICTPPIGTSQETQTMTSDILKCEEFPKLKVAFNCTATCQVGISLKSFHLNAFTRHVL